MSDRLYIDVWCINKYEGMYSFQSIPRVGETITISEEDYCVTLVKHVQPSGAIEVYVRREDS